MHSTNSRLTWIALAVVIIFSMGVPAVADFTISTSPDSQAICTGEDAVYLVDLGFTPLNNDPVTLSSSGQPAGTTAGFSSNPVVPPGSSNLTISNTAAAVPGAYLITVTGIAPTSTHTSTVNLDVFDGVPGAATLSSPPDGASDAPLLPSLSWIAVSQAASYNLEVATDAGFGSTVLATTVNVPTFDLVNPLQQNTTYYWRVQPENSCGPSEYSSAFSFTTGFGPDGAPAPIPMLSTSGLALLLIVLLTSGLVLASRSDASR